MRCEMCGREDGLFRAKIENSLLNVCRECGRFGRIIEEVREARVEKPKMVVREESIEVIREDYARIIKKVRESMGLKQEDVAKKLGEKESVIHKLEVGIIEPSIELARKLERFFKVKLIEEYEGGVKARASETRGFTLGDLITKGKV